MFNLIILPLLHPPLVFSPPTPHPYPFFTLSHFHPCHMSLRSLGSAHSTWNKMTHLLPYIFTSRLRYHLDEPSLRNPQYRDRCGICHDSYEERQNRIFPAQNKHQRCTCIFFKTLILHSDYHNFGHLIVGKNKISLFLKWWSWDHCPITLLTFNFFFLAFSFFFLAFR